jgi:hypothetical protein
MSKIITKRQLNTLIESTLKEYGREDMEIGMNNMPGFDTDKFCSDHHNMDTDICKQHFDHKNDRENQSNQNGTRMTEDKMCESCGGMMAENICEDCGSTYMEEGKKPETKKETEFAALAEPEDEITYADKIAGATKNKKKKGGEVEESAKDLAESVTKTFNPSFLTENMDNFNKLINYRNK